MPAPLRLTASAFTLVEMLVSMAVLTLLIVLITQLVNSATLTTTASRKRMDADTAARLVFDRMAIDFGKMVQRKDVNYIFSKNNGAINNDAMFFYSEAPAYSTGTSNLSTAALVGYRIHDNPDTTKLNSNGATTPQLERLGQRLNWDGQTGNKDVTGMVFLTYSGAASATPAPASSLAGTGSQWSTLLGTAPYVATTGSNYFHVLSDQVFRMECCFLLRSGTFAVAGTSVPSPISGYSNAPTAIPPQTNTPTVISSTYFTDGNVYGLPPDLSGIVVTLALLDDSSRKITSGSQLTALAAKFSDSLNSSTTLPTNGTTGIQPGSTAKLPAQEWLGILTGLISQQKTQANNTLPPVAALSQVRIYQRVFYLNHN